VWNKIIIGAILVLVGFNSCSNEVTYKVKFFNDSHYEINKLRYQLREVRDSIHLAPFQTSETVTLTYITSWANFFGPGHLLFSVTSFSDSTGEYESNLYSGGLGRNHLSKDSINVIRLYKEVSEETFSWSLTKELDS